MGRCEPASWPWRIGIGGRTNDRVYSVPIHPGKITHWVDNIVALAMTGLTAFFAYGTAWMMTRSVVAGLTSLCVLGFAQYRSVLPYLINNDDPGYKERYQSTEDRERYDDTTKCILCAACTTSCPVYWSDGNYFGPAAIVNAHRFIFDSRDEAAEERLDILNDVDGVWRCRTTFNCTAS